MATAGVRFCRSRKIGLLALVALAFAVGFLLIIVEKGRLFVGNPQSSAGDTSAVWGKLAIPAIDDLRVGSRKILACGVAFTKPPSMRAMVTEVARRYYQGLAPDLQTCRHRDALRRQWRLKIW